jgi:ceramide glucosyltransferase
MIEDLTLAVAAATTLGHLWSCWRVSRRTAVPARPVDRTVFVTLLRPVCGVDTFDDITLDSSFHLDWPRYEIIFCAGREDHAAIPLVRELMDRHRGIPCRLLVGEDRISGNPKLNNLVKGWRAARGDRVVMADANLLLPPDYLDRLMEVEAQDVGLVSSPPIGTDAQGLWGEVEAAFLNGNQARLQLMADEMGLGFAQGKTLMWSRDFLDRNGGLRALGRNLAEDVAATKLVRAAGRRVRLSHVPFAQPIGRRSLSAIWGRQLRWSKVRRDGFPALFLMEPLNGALLPVLAAAWSAGPWGGALVAATFYSAELALCRRMGWPIRKLSLPAMVLRDVMMPLIWIASFKGRGIVWRGTSMSPSGLADQSR